MPAGSNGRFSFSADVKLDWEALRDCILRKGTPKRVHFMEFAIDGEIQWEVARRMGLPDGLDPADPHRGQKWTIAVQRALGYEYDTDPDALPSPITDLTVGASPTVADISRGAEVDVFRFSAASFGTYTIETQGETDVVMSLLGPDSQTDLVTENDDGGEGFNARIVSNLSAGTYFVGIRHFDPASTGPYSISVRATPTAVVPEISVNGGIVNGEIEVSNESDLYIFSATVSGIYTIETSGETDTFLSLYGPNSQSSFLGFDDDSGPRLNARIVADLSAGVYYLRVRHYSPTGVGPYGISVTR